MLNTIQLQEFVWGQLKLSKIPINEIITPNVFFYWQGLYGRYFHKKKYCIKFITQYKSEEAVYYFDSPDDLLFSLLKYQISQKSIHETSGYKYKSLALEIFKSIDDEYYNRAVIDFNNDLW